MKVLFHVIFILISAIIQVLIKDQGYVLGGIPAALIFLLTYSIPAGLVCTWWDKRHNAKGDDDASEETKEQE